MSDPQALAEAQIKQGTFNFTERLRGRNLPEEEVVMYLDEKLGYKLMALEEKLSTTTNKARVEKYEAELAEVRAELEPLKYTLYFHGITNEAYEKLVNEVYEAYPKQVEEIKNPFTGEISKQELPNEDRDTLFTNKLWATMLYKVVDPDGNVDENIDLNLVASLRATGPVDGLRRISETIATLRMAVTWMDHLQGEDFFPKP